MSSDLQGGVTRLGLQHFRNYAQLSLPVAAKHVVLTGPNGVGKTNILEALSLLSPGRGLRHARPGDWRQSDAMNAPWGIAATLEDDERLRITGPADGRLVNRRQVFHEDTPLSSQAELADILAVLWLTPQMDGLFLDDAAARRRFFDRLVYAAAPDHAQRLQRYEHALRQRNRLLKDNAATALIQSLHPILVAEGIAIAASRLELTERLNNALGAMDTPFSLPHLTWTGWVEDHLQENSAAAVEELWQQKLRDHLDVDRAVGQTRVGVHRSDVAVMQRQKDIPAAQCSTGEQKALLIALVLAHAAWVKSLAPHRPLILLLDDVAAHLDADRRVDMFAWAAKLPAQIWFTGTDTELFALLQKNAEFFNLPF